MNTLTKLCKHTTKTMADKDKTRHDVFSLAYGLIFTSMQVIKSSTANIKAENSDGSTDSFYLTPLLTF